MSRPLSSTQAFIGIGTGVCLLATGVILSLAAGGDGGVIVPGPTPTPSPSPTAPGTTPSPTPSTPSPTMPTPEPPVGECPGQVLVNADFDGDSLGWDISTGAFESTFVGAGEYTEEQSRSVPGSVKLEIDGSSNSWADLGQKFFAPSGSTVSASVYVRVADGRSNDPVTIRIECLDNDDQVIGDFLKNEMTIGDLVEEEWVEVTSEFVIPTGGENDNITQGKLVVSINSFESEPWDTLIYVDDACVTVTEPPVSKRHAKSKPATHHRRPVAHRRPAVKHRPAAQHRI